MATKELQNSPSENHSQLELVNIAEAARVLSVSVSTLYGWVWQRKIAFVKVGRAVRFEMSDLHKFIQQRRVQPRRNT